MDRVRRSFGGLGLLLALITLSTASCFDPTPQEMRIAGVTPFVFQRKNTTQVTLNGNFYVAADADFGRGHAANVNDTFTANLDSVALQNVTYENSTTLQATVPANKLGGGTHTLTVGAPDGQVATLEHAVVTR